MKIAPLEKRGRVQYRFFQQAWLKDATPIGRSAGCGLPSTADNRPLRSPKPAASSYRQHGSRVANTTELDATGRTMRPDTLRPADRDAPPNCQRMDRVRRSNIEDDRGHEDQMIVLSANQPYDAPSATRKPFKIRGRGWPLTWSVASLGLFNRRVRSGAICVKTATYFSAFDLSPTKV
jgi:hypothetical protein